MGGEVERGTYEYDGGFNYITHRRSVKIISFSDRERYVSFGLTEPYAKVSLARNKRKMG